MWTYTTQPTILYSGVDGSGSMNTWMNEEGEGCFLNGSSCIFRFPTNLLTCYLSSWTERKVWEHVRETGYLDDSGEYSQTYVFKFSEK